MAQTSTSLTSPKLHSHNCRKIAKGRPKQYVPLKDTEGQPWTAKYSPRFRLIQHN